MRQKHVVDLSDGLASFNGNPELKSLELVPFFHIFIED